MTNPPTTPVDEKLLPCPFCNREGAFVEEDDDGYAYCGCTCTVTGPLRKGEAEAIAAWNTRTGVSQ